MLVELQLYEIMYLNMVMHNELESSKRGKAKAFEYKMCTAVLYALMNRSIS